MTTHVMHDLETLSTQPDSVIVSIGAVVIRDLELADQFHVVLDLHQPDRHICVDTVQWWMGQSDTARAVFRPASRKSLYEGLKAYQTFIDLAKLQEHRTSRVWGNGADFDNVILADAFHQLQLTLPWPYWRNGCFRTLKAIAPQVPAPAFEGTKHDALNDAIHQAKHLIEILKYLDQK